MDFNATTFVKNAISVAEHFGFRNAESFKNHPSCKSCTTKIPYSSSAQEKKSDSLSGLLTCGAHTYCDSKLHNIKDPLLFYSIEQVPRTGEVALSLHVYNVEKSIADALLIQTSRAMVDDFQLTNHRVRINSLGDRDSIARYNRELTNFLRKRLEEMPDQARELMKEHVMAALSYLIEKEHDLAYRSPNPLEYLSDQSRKHFREIVEFLDMANMHYEIDPKLIGNYTCYNDALFAIDILDDDMAPMVNAPLTIRGGRYSEYLARTAKQNVPAAGAVVIARDKKAPTQIPKGKHPHPSAYVIQLGFGPKIKTLVLIDQLRKAGIMVHQNLASDSLSSQLRDAEARNVSHVIIMGQKEFVDNTVILRDMIGRNQEAVPIKDLPQKIKKAEARNSR